MTSKPWLRGDFQIRKGMGGAVHSFFVCPICGEDHSRADHENKAATTTEVESPIGTDE